MDILTNILKEQNKKLLEQIADAYGWDRATFLQKYWSPSFYLVVPKKK